jgi:hypothetical protein
LKQKPWSDSRTARSGLPSPAAIESYDNADVSVVIDDAACDRRSRRMWPRAMVSTPSSPSAGAGVDGEFGFALGHGRSCAWARRATFDRPVMSGRMGMVMIGPPYGSVVASPFGPVRAGSGGAHSMRLPAAEGNRANKEIAHPAVDSYRAQGVPIKRRERRQ